MKKKNKKITVAVSGGFDPIHIGHRRMFQEAKKLGNRLVVILNNDNWIEKKKGFVFMPQKERKELIEGIKEVDEVFLTDHKKNPKDMSVISTLRKVHPDIFANGGDRTPGTVPEQTVCEELHIRMVYNVGHGGKVQSSSWLTSKVAGRGRVEMRPWGHMHTYASEDNWWVKSITVRPGHRLSLQSHKHRSELWVCVKGKVTAEIKGKAKHLTFGESVRFGPGTTHRLSSKSGGTIIEVAHGKRTDETDIIRYKDDYGRVA